MPSRSLSALCGSVFERYSPRLVRPSWSPSALALGAWFFFSHLSGSWSWSRSPFLADAAAGTASSANSAAIRIASVRGRELMDQVVGRFAGGTQAPGRLSGVSGERQLVALLDGGRDRADRRALALDLGGRVAVDDEAALHGP